MARWRVDIIRKRAEHLGTVVANTEKPIKRSLVATQINLIDHKLR